MTLWRVFPTRPEDTNDLLERIYRKTGIDQKPYLFVIRNPYPSHSLMTHNATHGTRNTEHTDEHKEHTHTEHGT
jgi:hypothetical protein